MKKQNGLSLIELLVATVLALVIIGGIVQVFVSNRQAYALSEAMIRTQETGRFAISFISEAIRNSGSYGCAPSLNADSNNIQAQSPGIVDLNAIQTSDQTIPDTSDTWEGSGNADFIVDTATAASYSASIGGSPDRLSLFQLTTKEYEILDVNDSSSRVLYLPETAYLEFEDDDVVLAGNCYLADVIVVKGDPSKDTTTMSVTTTKMTLEDSLRDTTIDRTDILSTLSEVQHLSFAVDVDEENLVVQVNGGAAQSVIGGIENIQFQYGVDTDGDLVADYFDDIDDIVTAGQQDEISAVSISVLAVSGTDDEGSAENVTTSGQSITYNGTTSTMADNRYRAVFNSTVVLRNRMN